MDKELIRQAVSKAKGGKGETSAGEDAVGPHEEAVAKIVHYYAMLDESKPPGRRARMLRRREMARCEQALRQFVFGGVPAAGAAEAAGLNLDKITLP